MPPVPERVFAPGVSLERMRLINLVEKKWLNGTMLRYYFWPSGSFAGADVQKDMVREGFKIWKEVGIGIEFEETININRANVRIGFLKDDGAWSYVGRDNIDYPGPLERTMNFGWDLTKDPRGVDVAVHEIGHLLGAPHEHQNPFSGIVWDEAAVYEYFGAEPNRWPKETTYHNVLAKLPLSSVEGSAWDPDSVMHYGFPAGLIVSPEQYRSGIRPAGGLSQHDIAEVKKFYPPPKEEEEYPRLVPCQSQCLSLAPAEQANFLIEVDAKGKYMMQTFGKADMMMVLFEEVSGELVYISGDDDSGTDENASIKAVLHPGKRYVLKLRLYLNYAYGDTAVMLWAA